MDATAQVTVAFTAADRDGCGSLHVQLQDQSSSTAGQIVAWDWNLDAGGSSSLQNPGKVFTEPGVFDICLTATDEAGNSATLCKEDFIRVNRIPQVDFVGTTTRGCVRLTCDFKAQVESSGTIAELIWDLGGQTGVLIGGTELATVTGKYFLPDQYTVSLTAIDEHGCIGYNLKEGYIQAGMIDRPTVSVANAFGCQAPLQTSFSFSDYSSSVIYTWDFNNGQTYSGSNPPPQTYSDQGVYDLIISAFDPATDCRDTFFYKQIVTVGVANDPTVDLERGCVDTRFQFADNFPDDGATYLWDFGDGGSSTESRPAYQYSNPGCYAVILTKSLDGCTSTAALDFCIEIVERPEITLKTDKLSTCRLPASFHLALESLPMQEVRWTIGDQDDEIVVEELNVTSDTNGLLPISVRSQYMPGCWIELNDTLFVGELDLELPTMPALGCIPLVVNVDELDAAGFAIDEWRWNLSTSPGQVSGEKTPSFSIDDAGSYDLRLIASTTDGCVDTVIAEGYIRAGSPPQFDISSDFTVGCADTAVSFVSSFSTPVDETHWLFGDGGESLEMNPEYMFTDTGNFTVILQAGYNGCYSTDSIVGQIGILASVSAFEVSVVCGSREIMLTDLSIGADSIHYVVTQGGSVVASSEMPDATFVLPNRGKYEIVQTTWNFATGCVDEFRDSIDISRIELDVKLQPMVGCVPLEVAVVNETQVVALWKWEMPEATILNDSVANPSILITKPGVYNNLKVKLVDQNGCKTSRVLDEVIYAGAVTPDIGTDPYEVCPATTFQLTNNTLSEIPIVSWEWTVGNDVLHSQEKEPLISGLDTGYHTVQLTITDSLGCSAKIRVDSLIHVFERDLSFRGDTATCVGAESTYILNNSRPGITYRWDFGDGSTDKGRKVTHTFSENGTYSVCVTIKATDGCDSIWCNTVTVESPQADFAADTTFISCPPLIVNFHNLSTGASAYIWKFGDGSGISRMEEPSHVYTASGTFDVQLIAKRSKYCIDTSVLMK